MVIVIIIIIIIILIIIIIIAIICKSLALTMGAEKELLFFGSVNYSVDEVLMKAAKVK